MRITIPQTLVDVVGTQKEVYACTYDCEPPTTMKGDRYRGWFHGAIWLPFTQAVHKQILKAPFDILEHLDDTAGWNGDVEGINWHSNTAYLRLYAMKFDGEELDQMVEQGVVLAIESAGAKKLKTVSEELRKVLLEQMMSDAVKTYNVHEHTLHT